MRSRRKIAACKKGLRKSDTSQAGRSFDLIVGANLVDRLDDPLAWIQQSKELLSDEGILVVISPFTWLESVTPEARWLGGVRKDSEVRMRALDQN